MSRGRSSSSGRGSSRSSWSSSRGSSRSSWGSSRSRGTTIIWHSSSGGSHGSGSGSFSLLPVAIFLIIFGAIVLFAVVPSIFNSFDYGKVSAVCLENDKIGGWYYTTYEYEVDGVEYTNRSEEGWEFPETIGKNVTIYYLKDDPNVITEQNPGFTTADGIWLVIGIGFVAGGIGLIFLNKKIKAQKKLEEASQSQTTEQVLIEKKDTKVKCPYCGSSYDNNETSCPNCGSNKQD